ncbi:putative phage tail protein [Clostridium sp. YIM B02569]|uniref:putative phage tail protein n=1 Tax=Clostridium sp. YIM B02569 TaxID=2911967 RepID=UPI001EEBBB48|nr:putative phage tail protein [Clostridium sp. YIM B02569]
MINIDSKKGQEMLNSVSPIYDQNVIMKGIFEAIGSEADSSSDLADDLLLQFFLQTATWGLDIWEQRLNITTNHNEEITTRRAKILTKLQSKTIINPEKMAYILKNFVSADIDIKENIAPYTFKVELLSYTGFPNDLKDLYNTVKRIKPSHLAVEYNLISILQSDIYYHLAIVTGESIEVYPWAPKDIESKGKFEIGIIQSSGAECITTYPK